MNKKLSFRAHFVALVLATSTSMVLPVQGLLAATQTTTYTYNALGLVETIDGPRTDVDDVSTFNYDTSGNLIKLTNALGHITEFTSYDNSGRALTALINGQLHIELSYDVRGRLIQTNEYAVAGEPLQGRKTLYTYTPAGDLNAITLPGGQSLTYTYDDARRLTDIMDNEGNRIFYQLDAMGNQLAEYIYASDIALVRQRQAVYNQLGQLFQSLGAQDQTSEYSYDPNGNITGVLDARNNATTQAFDALNRLIKVTDAHLGVTVYSYDQANNLASVTDPNGHATVYQYDGLGNLTQLTSPDTGITTYQYDSAGNRIQETNANGIVINYSYDALNRLTGIQFPDTTQDIVYHYDGSNYLATDPNPASHAPIGQRTGMEDSSGRTLWYYNSHGEPIQQTHTLTLSGHSYTLTHQYQQDTGLLVKTTYPGGDIIDYSYDAFGKLRTIHRNQQIIVNNIQYQPFGGIKSFDYGNGLNLSRTYDLDGRLQSQDIAGSNPLQKLIWSYNPVGSVSTLIDQLNTLNSQTFSYDNLDRLLTAATDLSGYGLLQFNYDANGNRILQDDNAVLTNYNHSLTSNWLNTSSGGHNATFSYDDLGNIIGKSDDSGNYIYSYNQDNRLNQIQFNGEVVGQYHYNGLGQRSHKSLAGQITDYVYNLSGQLIAEIDADTGAMKEYFYLDGEPLAMYVQSAKNLDSYLLTGTNNAAATDTVSVLATVSNQTLDITMKDGRELHAGLTGSQWQTTETATEFVHALDYTDATGLSISGTITINKADNRSHSSLTITEVPLRKFSQTYHANGIVTQVNGSSEPVSSYEFGFVFGTMIVTSTEVEPAPEIASTQANVDTVTKKVNITYADGSSQEFQIADAGWSQYAVGQYTRYDFSYQQGGEQMSGHLLQGANETKASIDVQLGYESNATYTMPEQVSGLDVVELYYYHNDHLGTPKLLTDKNQLVVWEGQYSPFGEVTTSVANVENNLRFAGQYFDAESGLHYNYHRYYDPSLGRYITSDPIGLEGGLNTYIYVDNNPLNWIDPFGLTKQDKWYGYNDKAFKDWVHGEKQAEGRRHNYTKSELEKLKQEWDRQGQPGGKGKTSGRGGGFRGRGLGPLFIGPLLCDTMGPSPFNPFCTPPPPKDQCL